MKFNCTTRYVLYDITIAELWYVLYCVSRLLGYCFIIHHNPMLAATSFGGRALRGLGVVARPHVVRLDLVRIEMVDRDDARGQRLDLAHEAGLALADNALLDRIANPVEAVITAHAAAADGTLEFRLGV